MNRLRQLTPLQIALALSALAHLGLLTLHVAPAMLADRVLSEQPLAVVLVNAQDDEADPDQASAVAQARLTGGGTEARGRVTSPLPASEQDRVGVADGAEPSRQPRTSEPADRPLLASLRLHDAALPLSERETADRDMTAPEREQRQRELSSLLAAVEQRVNLEASGPRQRYIGAATREAVYARYYAELRRRIEERGTAEFPQLAGRRLYGELTLLITVAHDGRVLTTELLQGSGNEALDLRTQALVRGMRFDSFDAALRQRADQVVVASRFRFTPGEQEPR
jgi:periplasmic protein TonB